MDYIPGRNAVIEALKSGEPLDKIYLAEGAREGSIKQIEALARDKRVPVSRVDRRRLDELYSGNHQGVVAACAAQEYAEVDDLLAVAAERGEAPFLLMLAHIEDPHNLGAILRTAEIAGVHGVILPRRDSAGLNATVRKVSAGAASYLPVARVANLVQTAKELQARGLWLYGAAMDGQSMYEADLRGPALLVIGGEDRGIPRLLAETCDFSLRIPMQGKVPSLNASVAAGVLIYEFVRQRRP